MKIFNCLLFIAVSSLMFLKKTAAYDFSDLSERAKMELFLRSQTMGDLLRLATSNKAGKEVLKKLLLQPWEFIRNRASPQVGMLFPYFKISKELRLNPNLIYQLAWRQNSVKMLLDRKFQFSKIPKSTFQINTLTLTRLNLSDFAYAMQPDVTHWASLNSYWIQKTSVTQLLWFLVMGTNPAHFQEAYCCANEHIIISKSIHPEALCPRNPIENISWNHIAARDKTNYLAGTFLKTLKTLFKIHARLPTEAEREYAAPNSDLYEDPAQLQKHVWWHANSKECTHAIAEREPNLFGLFDSYGNVWNWVEDDYFLTYPVTTWENSKNHPNSQHSVTRVILGGSYLSSAEEIYLGAHAFELPETAHPTIGFRLALEGSTH